MSEIRKRPEGKVSVEDLRKEGVKIIGGSQKIGKDGKREGVKIIDRNTKP